jgi:hypothetical protein
LHDGTEHQTFNRDHRQVGEKNEPGQRAPVLLPAKEENEKIQSHRQGNCASTQQKSAYERGHLQFSQDGVRPSGHQCGDADDASIQPKCRISTVMQE